MARKQKLSNREKLYLFSYYTNGVEMEKIMERFNISERSVYYYVKRRREELNEAQVIGLITNKSGSDNEILREELKNKVRGLK